MPIVVNKNRALAVAMALTMPRKTAWEHRAAA